MCRDSSANARGYDRQAAKDARPQPLPDRDPLLLAPIAWDRPRRRGSRRHRRHAAFQPRVELLPCGARSRTGCGGRRCRTRSRGRRRRGSRCSRGSRWRGGRGGRGRRRRGRWRRSCRSRRCRSGSRRARGRGSGSNATALRRIELLPGRTAVRPVGLPFILATFRRRIECETGPAAHRDQRETTVLLSAGRAVAPGFAARADAMRHRRKPAAAARAIGVRGRRESQCKPRRGEEARHEKSVRHPKPLIEPAGPRWRLNQLTGQPGAVPMHQRNRSRRASATATTSTNRLAIRLRYSAASRRRGWPRSSATRSCV
jgi:hypothetical protein